MMKKLHKWPSLVIALFIILWAISGVILNHRSLFSPIDVNRNLLPGEHRYNNWNNAAIRSAVRLDTNRVVFFGNVGPWCYDERDASWESMREGLPSGADHYRINTMLLSSDSALYAGTRFGLYRFDWDAGRWMPLSLPARDPHVVDIMELDESLWVMTRSFIFKSPLQAELSWRKFAIPAPGGYDNKVGLFKTLWVIHSGEIYGIGGKLIVDGVALVFVFLTLSGLVYFFFPRWMKRRRRNERNIRRLAFWNKWSLKWHNKIGIWLAAILILTTFTGMFLRPPLLIAIASGRVDKIPWSVLDDGNAWYDQLRRMLYDNRSGMIMLATSEGIFMADTDLARAPEYVWPQPPASVMGHNVFCHAPGGGILVGSFNGLFVWDPVSGGITDYLTGRNYDPASAPGMPISDNMVAGYFVDTEGREYVFDYNAGGYALRHLQAFMNMPPEISRSPMPLWNVALEMHTARLLKPMLGDLYILFIPLFGLTALMILVSGIVLWIRKYSRRSPR